MTKYKMFKLIRKKRNVENPPTFVFLLLGEFLFVYSQEATYGLCISQVADDLDFIPLHTRYIMSIYIFFGILNGIFLAFLADLYLNKYLIVVFGHVISTSSMLFSTLLASKILPEKKLGVQLLIISSFIFASMSVIRYSYLAEKIDKNYLYIVSTLRIFTICLFRSFSLFNNYNFYIASGAIMTLANLLYLIDLLFLRYTFSPRKMTLRKESVVDPEKKFKLKNCLAFIRKMTIFVIFLLFSTYGFCSQLLHVAIQDQLNYISYENDFIYFPYNVINPILVLILLSPVILLLKFKKNVNNRWFIYGGLVIISVSLALVSFAQRECEKNKKFPGYGYSYLSLYNGLKHNLSIKSDLIIVEVPTCEYYTEVFSINGTQEAFIQFSFNPQTTYFHKIELNEAQISSYVFQYWDVKKFDFDPLYYSKGGFNVPGYPTVSIVVPKEYMIGEISFHKPEERLNYFDVKKTKLKKLVMFGDRDYMNVPPGKYHLKFSGNGRLYFTNETFTFKVGGVYSVVINHCKIDVQSYTDSCSFGLYSLLVYFALFFHCLAEAVSLVPVYLFLYDEFKGKYKYTEFSFVFWAYTTGHGAQIWKTWFMHYDFKLLFIYFIQHIIFASLFIILSLLYYAKKTENVQDKPNIQTQ